MERRRIALVLPSLEQSGLVRVMVNLAEGFADRNLAADLVVPTTAGALADHVPDDVKVVPMRGHDQYSVTWLPSLVHYLRQADPDWLLAAANNGSLVALIAQRLAHVATNICVSIHTHFPSHLDRLHPLQSRVLASGLNRAVREADQVIAVSEGAAQGIAAVSGLATDAIEVVPNPVVSDSLHNLAAKPAEHAWLAADDRPVVVFLGRLVEHKDIPTLLQSVDYLRESRDVGLLLVGEGPKRPALERLVIELGLEDAVEFLGYVDNPYPLVRAADVLAFSSVGDEGLPSVIIEAMACGCPVVATDCRSGPREILADGEYGELVPTGNPSAMASGIERVLTSPPDPDRLYERAMDFSVERATNLYLEVLCVD